MDNIAFKPTRAIELHNAIPHESSKQEYACNLTRCSFYFGGQTKTSNSARATLSGLDVLLFKLQEENGEVDVFISIPDDFLPTHYFQDNATTGQRTKAAHLTYHGRSKKKKMSGEIHLVSNGHNIFSGTSNMVSAPLAFSSDIPKYPLPICRLELNLSAGRVHPKKYIPNFFELHPGDVFFNTVEIHLARTGFLHSIASCSSEVSPVLGSSFIHTSMHLFYLNKLERRPGLFPQVFALQTKNYELVIFAAHEYKNSQYQENAVRYFHTEDYFRRLVSRNVLPHGDGWFVDQQPNQPHKSGHTNMSNLLK